MNKIRTYIIPSCVHTISSSHDDNDDDTHIYMYKFQSIPTAIHG